MVICLNIGFNSLRRKRIFSVSTFLNGVSTMGLPNNLSAPARLSSKSLGASAEENAKSWLSWLTGGTFCSSADGGAWEMAFIHTRSSAWTLPTVSHPSWWSQHQEGSSPGRTAVDQCCPCSLTMLSLAHYLSVGTERRGRHCQRQKGFRLSFFSLQLHPLGFLKCSLLLV